MLSSVQDDSYKTVLSGCPTSAKDQKAYMWIHSNI